jgi:IS1 family transposase
MYIIGLKKTAQITESDYHILELDELYWFVGKKPKTKTRENTYVMTMVSRLPRQIVGFDVAFDKSPNRIQSIVDDAPEAESYCTDGWSGYVDVAYLGRHIRNVCNKNDTFTVEGVNADLRHYSQSNPKQSHITCYFFAILRRQNLAVPLGTTRTCLLV